ncbi:hypothetical protein Y032_0028g1804 [Ancylostoma ceylanicum]|uniref:DUF7596 domain-containing protein n=1 Tax=Ancylostoma ceylanicum TaxID=53326 RepID=A0A016UU43_9BILA|nr:hypothetical protein Y032_0028g1804 [Ancylostoma ceylanicum]
MLAAPSLASLAEKSLANYVLGGGLLPLNNNAAFIRESTAVIVTIVDKDDRAVACGAVSLYSAKQAYCVLGEVSDEYRNHTIWIEEVPSEKKESRVYRITRSVPQIVDRTAPTMFETVFADHNGRPTLLHLVDALVDSSVGKINLDLNKNLTIDLFEGKERTSEELVSQWRDISGFVVSDRFRFEEVLIDRSYLTSLKQPGSAVSIEKIDKDNLLPVLDYDGEVSIYDRTEHVTALLHTPGISGNVALRDGQPCGYALACKNRILLCYAESDEVFKQLISSLAQDMKCTHCKMFVRNGVNEVTQKIIEASKERKAVTRLHTRTNIHGIKWNMVYCTNVGLHIF